VCGKLSVRAIGIEKKHRGVGRRARDKSALRRHLGRKSFEWEACLGELIVSRPWWDFPIRRGQRACNQTIEAR